MKQITLPRVPSKLIRLALSDLEKVQKMKTRVVDMSVWHGAIAGKYYVCLAGSVIDRTLKFRGNTFSTSYSTKFIGELLALHYFRAGDCDKGFAYLDLSPDKGVKFSACVPRFSGKGTKFKKAMHKLADDLEAAGY